MTASNLSPAAQDAHPPHEQEEVPAQFQWHQVVWYNVSVLLVWHIGAVYTLLWVVPKASYAELLVLWIALWGISGLGITAGAHRLWAHRSYKAKWPLRVFLMLCNSMAFEGSIFEWSRDHRVHHKGSDTNADPHNSSRGFFFAHMGWVMVRKHPNVFREGKKINMSDLMEDPIVRFQHNHYFPTVLVCCYGIPVALGAWLGNWWHGFLIGGVFRHIWVLHATWCVNSVAHFFGYKPYDRNIRPVENLFVSVVAIGEGYHNYHHKYPSDYSTSEFGLTSGQYNPTKLFIDTCAWLGLAYDMKRSRTAAATRERVALEVAKEKEERLAKEREQQEGEEHDTPSWMDKLLHGFFFGRTHHEHVF